MDEGTIRLATVGEESPEDEDGYLIVGLAEQVDGGGGTFILTRALEFDEQDRAQGMDTYCLSLSDGVTHYGGVISWGLKNRGLVIQLDEETSKLFNADGGYRLNLQLDDASIHKLEEGLARILVHVPRNDDLCV